MRTSLPILLFAVLLACNTAQNDTLDQMQNLQATLELKTNAQLGEGAFWNHQSQEFYWVDIEGKALNIYDPATRQNRSFPTPSRIGTVVPANDTTAVIALEDGIYLIHTQTGELQPFAPIEADVPANRFNDGKCDPAGRLWVGSMPFAQDHPGAKVYMVNGDGSYETKIEQVTISNGIVWTADQKTMYYIDTPTGQIRGYDFEPSTGAISNERVVVEVPETLGYPDGMTIDAEDRLWVGLWNGGAIGHFDPQTGQLIGKVEVPGALNVTACAFGGPNLDTLYITTASIGMEEAGAENYQDAGSLFKAVPGVKGVKSPFFKLNP
ncbi:MAG: SMP-30/gluconolactonase/LRE family protein [Phaeodactylibacter sp.]|nr:SMP-30/gluconolactonase/LRE family protein [Phaeodactylibacter sp.]